MKKNTAIYARYSSHAQDGGTSIEVQTESCRKALVGADIREYIDQARTGRAMAGREALLRLLDDAAAGQIDRVIVYKYDRIGRNLAETSAIVAQLEDSGVEVVSATEGKDAMARGMHMVISEYYSRALAERTHAGLMKRFEQGAWTGGPAPYGYMVVKTDDGVPRLKVNPDEAPVVKWMFETYTTESAGLKELAHRLRDRGVPTRKSPFWTHTSVRRVLTNDICTGRFAFNQRRFKLNKKTGRRVPIWRDASEHSVRQDEALRLVDNETFAEVDRRLGHRASPSGDAVLRNEAKPFTGIIFCETCGSVFYRRKSKNRKGEYFYYNCGCRQRNGPETCGNSASIREDLLLVAVTRTFGYLLDDADSIVEDVVEEARGLVRENRGEAQKVRSQLLDLDKKIGKMTGLLTDPDIDATAKKAISRQVGELEVERERLQQVVAGLADRANDNTERMAGAVRQALGEIKETLAAATTNAEIREYIERWVGPMILRPDGTLVAKETAPDFSGAGVKGSIAGGGFEPPTSGL